MIFIWTVVRSGSPSAHDQGAEVKIDGAVVGTLAQALDDTAIQVLVDEAIPCPPCPCDVTVDTEQLVCHGKVVD